MKFNPEHNKKVSITLINQRKSIYGQPKYDIKIRVRNEITGEAKAVILPSYVSNSDTPRYKVTNEAITQVTRSTLKYFDGDPSYKILAEKVTTVLSRFDLNYIKSTVELDSKNRR